MPGAKFICWVVVATLLGSCSAGPRIRLGQDAQIPTYNIRDINAVRDKIDEKVIVLEGYLRDEPDWGSVYSLSYSTAPESGESVGICDGRDGKSIAVRFSKGHAPSRGALKENAGYAARLVGIRGVFFKDSRAEDNYMNGLDLSYSGAIKDAAIIEYKNNWCRSAVLPK